MFKILILITEQEQNIKPVNVQHKATEKEGMLGIF